MRDLDDTQWIAAATDRPHDLAGDLSGNLGSYLKLNSFFRYSSGNPYTPALSILRDLNHWRWPRFYRLIYAPRNSSRYPDYFRIDMRVTFGTVILGASGEFYLEWMNVTNHRNVYQILWAGDLEEGAVVLKNVQQHKILMLPRLVVGGMALRF
jgi:hypothetical protein